MSITDAECTPQSKLDVLHLLSHLMYLTAFQMRAVLGCFKDEAERAEVFVTFFFRVVDIWNSKVFRVRFSDADELRHLQERLGYATFFPFIQPENAQFELDYSYHDQ